MFALEASCIMSAQRAARPIAGDAAAGTNTADEAENHSSRAEIAH
jgi:hypothetical protein